jgi:hypothetical protein
MATGIDLSCISQFNPNTDPGSVSQRWKDWLKRFQRFIVAMDIKDGTRINAIFFCIRQELK